MLTWHTGFRAGIVFVAVFFVAGISASPAHAATALHWNYLFDEGAGTVNQDAEVVMVDGGTYAVPLQAPGDVSITTTLPEGPFYFPAGELFFINPDTNEREFIGEAEYGLAWGQEGTYELDVYAVVLAPSRSILNTFFAWILPTAHAAINGEFIETIRFSIVEGPIPETPCCSSVLFLPGIKGSALKEGNDTLWPPSIWSNDISRLALDANGESVNAITVAGVLSDFYTADVYGGFAVFMDSLAEDTGDGTIRQWKPFAYDWRFPPAKILAEGVQTPEGVVDLVQTVEELASNSKTGKVTIVAHSMGGLMGKALIQKLEEYGEADLIDSFVMVGTPQLGTPQGASSLLHGDDEGILSGVIVDATDVREIAQNMESAYNLLPSASYFSQVSDPVITFATTSAFTQSWRNQWGNTIDSFQEFTEFVTGFGVTRPKPAVSELQKPEILRADVFASAAGFHDTYDSYVIPSNIRVVQVAGWGVPTVKSITYKDVHMLGIPPVPMQGYVVVPTIEGDSTVVFKSAISNPLAETYYFDLKEYRENTTNKTTHKDLLSEEPVQNMLLSIIERKTTQPNQFIVSNKPNPGNVADQLLVVTRSPIVLGVHDTNGNFTGIDPNQNTASGIWMVSEAIPNSYFLSAGGDQYIFLPKNGSYTFTFKGTGTGPATVEMGTFGNDAVAAIATYTDIPVTPTTEAIFVVNTAIPQETIIAVDANGDGQVDSSVTPDGYVPTTPTLGELIATLKTKIQSLDIKPKLKDKLLKKVEKIEKKIAKQKNMPASKVVANLEKKVLKKAEKGKIPDPDAEAILDLLEQIENAI